MTNTVRLYIEYLYFRGGRKWTNASFNSFTIT